MLRSSVMAWSLISRNWRKRVLGPVRIIGGQRRLQGCQAHAKRSQFLPRVVVQLARDALALILLRVDQLANQVLQLRLPILHHLVQTYVVDCSAKLLSEGRQQPKLGFTQGFFFTSRTTA